MKVQEESVRWSSGDDFFPKSVGAKPKITGFAWQTEDYWVYAARQHVTFLLWGAAYVS
jgi:hypothetical protein